MNVDGLGEITGYLDGEFNDVVAFRVSRGLKSPSHTKVGRIQKEFQTLIQVY